MITLNANEAKVKFGTMLMKAQSEPVKIVKNGSPVAVVLSIDEYNKIEEMKMELVKARFENIDEDDLMDGKEFRKILNADECDQDFILNREEILEDGIYYIAKDHAHLLIQEDPHISSKDIELGIKSYLMTRNNFKKHKRLINSQAKKAVKYILPFQKIFQDH